jgi:carbon monoxide dehydrogenase subunit G
MMLRISHSVCIDAPKEVVWATLSHLEGIQDWVEQIQHSYCVGDQSRGVDAVRMCELGRNITVRETVVAWDEGSAYTYVGEGVPMVSRAENRWSVQEVGSRTLVTSNASVELKGGMAGRLLEPVVKAMSDRSAQRSLAALKYLVEHGAPSPEPVTKLLPIPANC